MTKDVVPALVRPENKGIVQKNHDEMWRLDPELMQLHIANVMIEKMGTPSVLEKQFAVRYGIFTAINHSYSEYDEDKLSHALIIINAKAYVAKMERQKWMDENQLECRELIKKALVKLGNETGYDSSLRIAVYEKYAANSINENGLYFHNFWAWLNKPKYIIQGNAATMGMPQEEEKQSIVGKIFGWLRGGKKNDTTQQQ